MTIIKITNNNYNNNNYDIIKIMTTIITYKK